MPSSGDVKGHTKRMVTENREEKDGGGEEENMKEKDNKVTRRPS